MMGSTSSAKQVYRVNIFNQTYNIASSTSAEEFQHIADQVDNLMHTIASRTGTSDGARVGVLTAMHLADHLHLAQRRLAETEAELARLQAQIDRQTEHLDSLLKGALEPGEAAPPADPDEETEDEVTLFPIETWKTKSHGAGS